MVYGKGINDLPRGWIRANNWNYRVYYVWRGMIQRCYDEKYHKRQPTYKNCTVCVRWLTLSNFVEDIKLIDNYDYWLNHSNKRVALDKDIKSNGQNKCYCLENCCFTTIEENCRQATKTRDNTKISEALKGKNKGEKVSETIKGENHPRAVLVDRFDLKGNYIDTMYSFEYAQKMGFNAGNISSCCKGRLKSTGGFIFKYHKE